MKIKLRFRAFGELPRYFGEFWHKYWVDEEDYKAGKITTLDVLRLWWIIECH